MTTETAGLITIIAEWSTITGLSGLSGYQFFTNKGLQRQKIKTSMFHMQLIIMMERDIRGFLNKNQFLGAKGLADFIVHICIYDEENTKRNTAFKQSLYRIKRYSRTFLNEIVYTPERDRSFYVIRNNLSGIKEEAIKGYASLESSL